MIGDYISHLKQNRLVHGLVAEGKLQKQVQAKKIKYKSLIYHFKKKKDNKPKNVSAFDSPFHFLRKIRNVDTSLEK